MSRLAEILGVQEGQPFKFWSTVYRVKENRREYKRGDGTWLSMDDEVGLSQMIAHPEGIKPLLPAHSPETIQALRAISALWPDYPWIARDANGSLYGYVGKPNRDTRRYGGVPSRPVGFITPQLPEITFAGGPVYIPDVIGAPNG